MSLPVKWFLLSMTLLLFSCATGPISKINRTEGDLRGMLYDLDRQPVSDANVAVTVGGKTVVVSTDLHGRFGLGPLNFGPIDVKVEKGGFEALDWGFHFKEGSQVLYLQIASADQLFELAAAALEQKNWLDFQTNLDRARTLSPSNLQGFILAAIALELRGRPQDAITVLLEYPSERPILAIELQLGELYSQVGDLEKAKEHWRRALDLKEDAQLRARVGEG